MRLLKWAMLFSVFAVSTAWADSPPPAAVWKTQDLSFKYNGFTTRYSCSGLRDKLRVILLAMGARKDDLNIRYSLCGPDIDKPFEVLSLRISLATLQPASADAVQPITAHWQAVDVGRVARYERGDCELAEQVRQSLLPLFATRTVQGRDVSCAPRDTPTGTPSLMLEVLLPGDK